MANTASNVAVGKPKAAGGVYAGATSATLPSNSVSTLDASLVPLGYVSEDGVAMTEGKTTTPIRAWGGDEVRTVQTEHDLSFAFAFLETSTAVLGEVYGATNVTWTDANGGQKIVIKSTPLSARAYAFDMLDGATAIRIIVPNATITAKEDVVFSDGGAVSFGVTLSAYPDSSGNKAYIYTTKFAS